MNPWSAGEVTTILTSSTCSWESAIIKFEIGPLYGKMSLFIATKRIGPLVYAFILTSTSFGTDI